jgi:thiol-disulfide isomerase/thioredoxin
MVPRRRAAKFGIARFFSAALAAKLVGSSDSAGFLHALHIAAGLRPAVFHSQYLPSQAAIGYDKCHALRFMRRPNPLPRAAMKTKLNVVACAVIVALTIALAVLLQLARPAREPDQAARAAAAAAEFEQLAKEYDRVQQAQEDAVMAAGDAAGGTAFADETMSDEEWMKRGPPAAESKLVEPGAEVLIRYLEFAKQYPESKLAFDALYRIVERGPGTGDVHGKIWQANEAALDLLWANHRSDPRIVLVFAPLGAALPSHKAEVFLKRAMETSRNRSVRAAATYHLACYYDTLAKHHQRSAEIAAKPRLRNFERYWKIVVTPHLNQFPFDQNQNADEIDRLLATLIAEFADVPAVAAKRAETGKLHVELGPLPQPRTYADLARTMLFEVNNIKPGQPAPEIVGTDAEGKEFRLSDYRGKVVLLTFSADWCGTCVEMYPIHRNLVEKYRDRPFVHLSVNRDETLDELKSSTVSGQITWRSWWDGRHGPINEAWNNGGIPDLYLLDAEHIIQDVALSRFTNQEEFERAIEPLLQKAAARPSQ